jgi:23S rRNA (uracil1939-C5)-methyltransferase
MTESTGPFPPPEVPLVTLEKPVYGGACLARVDGKTVFVPLTLPGEQARIRITQSRSGYSTAEAESIVSAAPERVAPACPHYGACGGCHYQQASYEMQLAMKQAILRETLTRAGVQPPEEIPVLSADPWAYRNRIRLAFDAAGQLGYRGRRSHAVVPIAECPIAAPLLVTAARAAGEIAASLAATQRPAEISLFCDASETALLATLIVPAARSIPFEQFAQSLRDRIPALVGAELIVEPPAKGRGPAPPARNVAQWGAESLFYSGAGFDYRVDHSAFFQVNRWLIDALVDRVAAAHQGHLAWDLFAGVGLFARRLAAGFASVVAVESAPAAARSLAANLKGTAASSVRATTLEFLRRSIRDGRSEHIVPDLIVLDPPRTGLGPEITAHLAAVAAPVLVYVSCDPATLARDLRALLASGYTIESLTLADLFPQTFHLESIVQLRRR